MLIKRQTRETDKTIIKQVQEAIAVRRCAEIKLDEAVHPDLVDAAIFELRAADLRLNHLLGLARQQAVQEGLYGA